MKDLEQGTNPLHSPAVRAPNPVPTGSRFLTSTESYCAGYPNIEEPQWLKDEALRVRQERAAKASVQVIDTALQPDMLGEPPEETMG